MVVKTKFGEDEMRDILSNYTLGNLKKYKEFKSGVVQSNYLIITSKGKYVLRCYENKSKLQISLEIKFLEKLKNSKVPYTKPIRNKSKKFILEYNGKFLIFFNFLKGNNIKRANKEQIKEIGKYVGIIHNKVKGYNPEESKSKHSYSFSFARKLVRDLKEFYGGSFPQRYENLINDSLTHSGKFNILSKGLNHGDLMKDDLFFMGNKLTGILDFDDCFYGNLLVDVGGVLSEWCIERKIDYKKINVFLREYNKHRRFSNNEKKYIYDFMILALLIHGLWHLFDKKNLKSKIPPFDKLKILLSISKEEFNEIIEF